VLEYHFFKKASQVDTLCRHIISHKLAQQAELIRVLGVVEWKGMCSA